MNQDFDPTWERPSEKQMAALEWIRSRRFSMEEQKTLAEAICLANSSEWYAKIKKWYLKPPFDIHLNPASATFFRHGCAFLFELVLLGYDESKKRWWNFELVPEFQAKLLAFAVAMDVIKKMVASGHLENDPVFRLLPILFMGDKWQYELEKALNHTKRS